MNCPNCGNMMQGNRCGYCGAVYPLNNQNGYQFGGQQWNQPNGQPWNQPNGQPWNQQVYQPAVQQWAQPMTPKREMNPLCLFSCIFGWISIVANLLVMLIHGAELAHMDEEEMAIGAVCVGIGAFVMLVMGLIGLRGVKRKNQAGRTTGIMGVFVSGLSLALSIGVAIFGFFA